ncbi:hypothetical protein BHM03_00061707 [Ensete ventricosum]|nr:hypothetical protein BHM03_00061707 [Ensete ventricosum]
MTERKMRGIILSVSSTGEPTLRLGSCGGSSCCSCPCGASSWRRVEQRRRCLRKGFGRASKAEIDGEAEINGEASTPVAGFPAIWLIAVSAMVVEKAPTLLRARLCDPTYVHAAFKSCPQSNYRCHSPPYLPVETLAFLFLVLNLMDFPMCPVIHFSISNKKMYLCIGSKLKLLIASSIADAYNNSALLLGPRGSGKIAVRLSRKTEPFGNSLQLSFG